MNKRSAAIVAAGLVAVLALGGFAYSRGLTGPSVSAAAAGERASHPKPIVRTHVKRVVVHRSAPATAPRIVYSRAPSTISASASQDQSGSDDDTYDDTYDDEGEDHEFEGEEDQDDQQEQDDQSDDQHESDDD
jgi:hypothetical protein